MRMRCFVVSVLAAAMAGGCGSDSKMMSGNMTPDDGTMQPDDPMGSAGGGGDGQSASGAGSGGSDEPAMPTAGTGSGAAGMDMGGGAGSAGSDRMEPPNAYPDPRGCPDLDSGFPGDEACMLPPDPSEGFQIHIGPTDYDDPEQIAAFSFPSGAENSLCWSFHTPNTEDIYYQTFALSGRPGTHHIINTMYRTDFPDGTQFTMCMDGGTGTNPDILANLPGASKAYMPRRPPAPENANLGKPIPANAPSQADMHYFNFTDDTILREFWMNVYTVPADQVEEESKQIRGMGGFSWITSPIQPNTDMVYKYTCEIPSPGRIIALLGHYHAHGVRFSAFLRRQGGEPEKVFEMYDYNDPAIFTYDSVTQNPPFSENAAGAVSGILEVEAGDFIDWECHIINREPDGTPGPLLRYTNNVRTGEMCNLWGESVTGERINCTLP